MNRKTVLRVFEAHNPDFPINLADKELLAYEGKKKVFLQSKSTFTKYFNITYFINI